MPPSPGPGDSYVDPPRYTAPSLGMCDLPDSLHDIREPTIAQLLQEKALYSFSEWPKVLSVFPLSSLIGWALLDSISLKKHHP